MKERTGMFSRIAVINRGEPAVRLIRAVRELNSEYGYGIKVIALHTAAERGALFVRSADEGVLLRDKGDLGSPYLDHAELERAMIAARADACWPGWGFVSEDAGFVELCDRIGVTFIGPPAAASRKLGDKVQAKYLAEATGVPVAPWSKGPVEDLASALEHAEVIGYPMILKARSGGGGRGIRMVFDPSELEEAIERTQSEAQKAFNDPVIFMEKLVQGGRHIEVQVIADNHGNAWAPGIRDCSIQRRNQKLIEESGSPALTAQQDADLRKGAVALVKEAGYRGAGTVEFLYQPEEKMFAFLEVNTRLQVEHPITEESTGLDLVKLQILVADGHRLEGEAPPNHGYAIEARLNAEDADNGFAPSPGRVELLTLPTGPGIRVDTGIATGDAISPDYDSMVAKIIAWGRDRPEAMARLRVALRETTVVVKGGTTTKSFLVELLDHPEVINGTADTGWLDRAGLTDEPRVAAYADAALLYVAADVYESEEALERDAFLRSARGGRPRANHEVGREVELGYQGQTYALNVAQISPRRYRIEVNGTVAEVELERLSAFESRLTIGDRRHHIVANQGPAGHLVEVDSVSHRVSRDEGGMVRSPAPAVVVAVRAAAGTEVAAGDTIVILESMKMETPVKAPYAGRVREILVGVNSQVDAGGAILRLDKVEEEGAASTTPTVEFSADAVDIGPDARAQILADVGTLRGLIMGFDVSTARARAVLADVERLAGSLPVDDDELLHAGIRVLGTFADLCELSRNRPAGEEESDERVHSPREYFHSYLHSLDVEREGLPEAFRTRLLRVLRNYGITDLEPIPALEEAVHRVFLAQERVGDQIPVVAAWLERWRAAGASLTGKVREEVGDVVERLVVATRTRYPAIGDLARSIRYEVFERPAIEAARDRVYSGVRENLRQLAANPAAADHAERINALVASPEPLIRLLAEELATGGNGIDAMLEAMTRRYYKVRTLRNVRTFREGVRPYVTGDFELSGQDLHLVATAAEQADLAAALTAANGLAGQLADPANVVTDLYLSWPDAPEDTEQVSAEVKGALESQPALAGGRRVTVTVSQGSERVEQFTFRHSGIGLAEELVIRGMHPLTGQRMHPADHQFLGKPDAAVPEGELLHPLAALGDGDRHPASTGQRRLAFQRALHLRGHLLGVLGGIRPGQVQVRHHVRRIRKLAGEPVGGRQRGGQVGLLGGGRHQVQVLPAEFEIAGDVRPYAFAEGPDVPQRADLVVPPGHRLEHGIDPVAAGGQLLGEQPDERLGAGDQRIDALSVVRGGRIRGQLPEVLPDPGVDPITRGLDRRPLEDLVPDAAGQVADRRVPRPGGHHETLDHVADLLADLAGQRRPGRAPPLQPRGHHRDLVAHPFLGQEHPVDGLFQRRDRLQIGDAVIAQHPQQPGPERLRQPLTLDIQRMQVGVEVLARAVHPLVALLLAGRPVPGELAQIGERAQHPDAGVQQLVIVDGQAAGQPLHVGQHRTGPRGAHVETHDQPAERAHIGQDLRPGVRADVDGVRRELDGRCGGRRALLLHLVQPQDGAARVDLGVHTDQDLPDPAGVRGLDRGLHLRRFQDHDRVAGGHLGAGRGAYRDHHRWRGRAHHAALVPADPVADAVHLDQMARRSLVGDDVVPAIADGQPALERRKPFELHLGDRAVDLDPIPPGADLRHVQGIRLALVPELHLPADLVVGARPTTARGPKERVALQRFLGLVHVGGDVQQSRVRIRRHPRFVGQPGAVQPAGVRGAVDDLRVVQWRQEH